MDLTSLRRALTPSGSIYGTILDDEGHPVSNAQVRIYGSSLSTYSDCSGRYRIDNIPVAAPRYIVIALKKGYIEGMQGNINIIKDEDVRVDLELIHKEHAPEYLSEELTVLFGYLIAITPTIPNLPTLDAILEPSLYPEKIRPFLNPGKYIESEDPLVSKIAEEILSSIPKSKRKKQTVIAKAVYDWVVKNIKYDLMRKFPNDVTCGEWQTTFGAWGHSFEEWCYTASEVLRTRRAICIEFARLTTALLRALKIPARPAPLVAHPVTQWWVQLPNGMGYWCSMDTSRGSLAYEERGDLWAEFPSANVEHMIGELGYAINEDAPIHMYWHTERPCLWRENYGERHIYGYSEDGLRRAKADLEYFELKGHLPYFRRRNMRIPPMRKHYVVQTRGFSLTLSNIGDQRNLTVKFPLPIETEYRQLIAYTHWTNHPEWIRKVWIEEVKDKRTMESLKLYCINFLME